MKKLMPLLILLLAVLALAPTARAADDDPSSNNFCLYLFSAGEKPNSVKTVLTQYGLSKAEVSEALTDLPKVIIPDMEYMDAVVLRNQINFAGGTARVHIKGIQVTGLKTPHVGESPYYFWPNVVAPHSEYAVESYTWQVLSPSGWTYGAGDAFIKGRSYRMEITLIAKNECRFEISDLTRVTVNGEPAEYRGSTELMVRVYSPAFVIGAGAMENLRVLGYHDPIDGETAGLNIGCLNGDSDRWYVDHAACHWVDDSGRILYEDEYFRNGKSYHLEITAKTSAEYCLAPSARATVEGERVGRVSYERLTDSTMRIELDTVTAGQGDWGSTIYGYARNSQNPQISGWFAYDTANGYVAKMWQWPEMDVYSAAYGAGNIFGFTDGGKRFFRFSVSNPSLVYSAPQKNALITDMLVYDFRTQTLYSGFRMHSSTVGTRVRSVDTATGELKAVDDLRQTLVAWTMDQMGQCIGVEDGNGSVCTVDLQTGEMRNVVPGTLKAADPQSLCCDFKTGKLYWFRNSHTVSGLYVLDPETGNAAQQTMFPAVKKGTVTALFTLDSPVAVSCGGNAFLCVCGQLEDMVPYEDPTHEAIDLCVSGGWMEPADQSTFRPTEKVTRGELALALWRLQGCPEVPVKTFSDVAADAPYAMAAAWADRADILSASWGRFHPNDVVDGQDLCEALYRHSKATSRSTIYYFRILDCKDWYKTAPWAWKELNWAVCHDLFLPGEDGRITLGAGADVTRASLALMLSRYAENLLYL